MGGQSWRGSIDLEPLGVCLPPLVVLSSCNPSLPIRTVKFITCKGSYFELAPDRRDGPQPAQAEMRKTIFVTREQGKNLYLSIVYLASFLN